MRRWVLCLVLGAAVVVPGLSATAAPATSTLGPEVTAWWSRTELGLGAPSVPPPGVGPQDLYVAGSTALRDLPVDFGPQAISGLRFRLPEGAVVQQLRLRPAGRPAPLVTFTACRALAPFGAVQAGPWSSVPPYDCTFAATARAAEDGSVLLDGVDRLRRGRDLVLVLVPGPLDNTVLAAPDGGTLRVSVPRLPVAPPADLPAPSGAVAVGPRTVSPQLSGGARPGTGAPFFGAPVLPATGGGMPSTGTAPVTAPVPVPSTAMTALTRDKPWVALLSTLAIALLAFVPLARPRVRELAADGQDVRGVGRFRSGRSGRVPDLL